MLLVKAKTIDAAAGKWQGILKALGADEKFLQNRHGACPFCGGSDRFRFDDKNGTGSFYCSQCGAGHGMDFLMKMYGWTFKEAAANVDSIVGNVIVSKRMDERTEADKVRSIRKVLSESVPVTRGDPVWTYLNRRTGVEEIPRDIRYHAGLFHSEGGAHPAMVAVIRDIEDKGVTLHRTYLTPDGEKAKLDPNKKLMPGKRLNGSAVRLSRVQECIGIGEGIETCLAASVRFGLPVWSATNSTLLEQFTPPEGVNEVWIMGDNDSSFGGQSAAFNLAKRLVRERFKVEIMIPEQADTDWCDYARE